MYWKSQLPFLHAKFCESALSTSYVLVINKNLEMQKIFFGVTVDDLKANSKKRKISIDQKIKHTEQEKEAHKKADYRFIESKTVQSDGGLLTQQHKLLSTMQDSQVKRLDKVDKLLGDGEKQGGPGSFLGMASLSYYFDQFAKEMLTKPSQAVNLLDLQEEVQHQRRGFLADASEDADVEMDSASKGEDQFVDGLSSDLEKAFAGIFM